VSFGFIPDVVLGDNVTADGQSGDNYYSYDGLFLGQYVLDEDTTSDGLRVGFWVPDEGRTLSINGYSRLTMDQLIEFDVNKTIPDHKDVYATATMRGTSDHWNSTDDSITTFTPALGGDFGPHFGFGVWPGFDDGAILVDVYGTDGSSTASANFWVTLADNQPSMVTTGALVSYNVTDPAGNPALNGGRFTFFGYRTATVAGDYLMGVVRSGFLGFDAVTMDSTPSGPTEIGFGAWQNLNFAYGDLAADEWIDGLVRVDWAVSCNQTDPDVIPGIRSRIRPGMPWSNNPVIPASNLPMAAVHGALRLSSETGEHPNIARLANNNQVSFRHYYYHPYGPDFPDIVGYYPSLWLAMDIIDIPESFGTRPMAGRIDIDRVGLEILPKPGYDVADATPLWGPLTGAGVHTGQGWTWGAGPIDYDPAGKRLGGYTVDLDPDGLTIRSSSASYNEQRVFGYMENIGTGVTLAETQGDLVRLAATIAQDDITSSPDLAKVDLRLRLFSEYREPANTLHIPQYLDDGDPLTTNVTTFVSPKTTGTLYEVYMETPLLASDPIFDQWGLAMDAINYYHPDPAISNPYFVRMACNVTLTDIRIDRITRY
jgi:hypothetical protein